MDNNQIKKLIEDNSKDVVDARSNFLKSIYEYPDSASKFIKDLQGYVETNPSTIVTVDFSNNDRHPNLDTGADIVISPAKVFEEENGVLTSVVSVNNVENHIISDTITTKELVDKFNKMLGVDSASAYTYIIENTVTYYSVSKEEPSLYTISCNAVSKKDGKSNEVVRDNIVAVNESEAYAKFDDLVNKRYPASIYDLNDKKVVKVETDKSIIRSELHPMSTACASSSVVEGISILGCLVKVLGLDDKIFQDSKDAADYINNLSDDFKKNNKIRVYDKFYNNITDEFINTKEGFIE